MKIRAVRCGSLVGLVVSIVFLASCAAPLHKALNTKEIATIEQTHVRTTIAQEEISLHVVKSTAGDNFSGCGIMGALFGAAIDKNIDASRSKKAEAWVAPLLEQTSDIDFRKDYWDAVLPALRSLQWMKVGETELAATGKKLPEEWLDDDVLLITASYELTPEGRFLVVGSRVQFWTKPKSKPSYYAFHSYVSKSVAPPYSAAAKKYSTQNRVDANKGKDAAGVDAVAKWAENGAGLYRTALNEGIQEIIRMILLDLPDAQLGTQHMSGTPAKMKIPSLLGEKKPVSVSGEILERGEDRVIFRLKDGSLMSLPLSDIEIIK